MQAERLLQDFVEAGQRLGLHDEWLFRSPEAQRILSATSDMQREIAKRLVDSYFRSKAEFCHSPEPDERWGERIAAFPLAIRIIRKKIGWSETDWVELIGSILKGNLHFNIKLPTELNEQRELANEVVDFMQKNGVGPALRRALVLWKGALRKSRVDRSDVKYWEEYFQKLEEFIDIPLSSNRAIPLEAGEAWSDAALADLKAMPELEFKKWLALIAHCQSVPSGTPSSKWQRDGNALVEQLDFSEFKQRMLDWFPLVDKPRTQPLPVPDYSHISQSRKVIEAFERAWADSGPDLQLVEHHAVVIKGLALCCASREDKELARALTALAFSAYRKLPGKGPREVKVGNACVAALGLMPGLEGVYQLALLKVRVKFGTAQKGIEKALTAAAERANIPRDELEEMAVPAYGLTEVGRSVETFGEFTAELRVAGTTSVELAWFKAGKPVKSVPAAVKQSHAEDLKELQTAAKDIARMLPAQRERLDSLFLQQREWPLAVWRERYLDHPLVGVLTRRLIWEFTTDRKTTAGMWLSERRASLGKTETESSSSRAMLGTPENGTLVDLDLRPIASLGDATTVRLWHPIGKDVDEIVAWRAWLDEQQIQQPFKQAHREVYLLTDAERRTRTYSNRYAAHVLKQHQFNALAALRGWKNKLRLMVDDEYPPTTLHLPKWNLRAEFWIEGIRDNYGADTNESGVYLRVATDQVRFYREGAAQVTAHAGGGGYGPGYGQTAEEPLPLEDIPPLVFSEVMRDVDLFVGVASVGNDPTWHDGGPDGRHRDYWQSVSFGDLTATAQTRKAVLERLVPKLKIAGQCSFADKFLVVRGSLRTYKIHLGSGNILMSPNDQYLCIVPKQSGMEDGKVFLPFEGDRTLSVILSKALLLANDTRIKDASIVSQIKR